MLGEHDRNFLLKLVADQQCGYFTAKQAAGCGFLSNIHHYQVSHGHWLRISKGLFRLPDQATTAQSEWLRWLLWSRNNQEQICGVLCRETALAYYGLPHETSEAVHISLPVSFRKRGADDHIRLYYEPIPPEEILTDGMIRVVTPDYAVYSLRERFERTGNFDAMLAAARNCRPDNLWRDTAAPRSAPVSDDILAKPDDAAQPAPRAPEMHSTRTSNPDNRTQDSHQEDTTMPERLRRRKANRMFGSPAAFTLVELLVVITIIGILASFLFPALRKTLDTSQQIKCLNTLRQMGVANTMYADQFGDWHTPLFMGLTGSRILWQNNTIYRQLMSLPPATNLYSTMAYWPKEYVCAKGTLAMELAVNGMPLVKYGYGANSTDPSPTGTGLSSGSISDPYRGFRSNQIKSPSKKLLYTDATDYVALEYRSDKYFEVGEFHDSATYSAMPAYRHNRGGNVLFCDGHGAWLPHTSIVKNQELWRYGK